MAAEDEKQAIIRAIHDTLSKLAQVDSSSVNMKEKEIRLTYQENGWWYDVTMYLDIELSH